MKTLSKHINERLLINKDIHISHTNKANFEKTDTFLYIVFTFYHNTKNYVDFYIYNNFKIKRTSTDSYHITSRGVNISNVIDSVFKETNDGEMLWKAENGTSIKRICCLFDLHTLDTIDLYDFVEEHNTKSIGAYDIFELIRYDESYVNMISDLIYFDEFETSVFNINIGTDEMKMLKTLLYDEDFD